MPLVGVSAAVVGLPTADTPLLGTPAAVAVVNEAAARGVPLLLLAAPSLTLQQLLPPDEALPSAHSPGKGPQLEQDKTGALAAAVGLTDKGWQWLAAAWERRLPAAAGGSVPQELLRALGMPDKELRSLGTVRATVATALMCCV
jgi:hypothetical protein